MVCDDPNRRFGFPDVAALGKPLPEVTRGLAEAEVDRFATVEADSAAEGKR